MRDLERELGWPVFTWGNQQYRCVPNSATASRLFSEGGISIDADLVLFVRREVLTAGIPVQKQRITYDGTDYRIDDVGSLPGNTVVRLSCNDANLRS